MTAEGSDGAPDDDLEGVAALPPAWNGTAALAASGAVERLAASGADGPLLEQLADGGLGAVARPPLEHRMAAASVLLAMLTALLVALLAVALQKRRCLSAKAGVPAAAAAFIAREEASPINVAECTVYDVPPVNYATFEPTWHAPVPGRPGPAAGGSAG